MSKKEPEVLKVQKDGVDVELIVKAPTIQIIREAQKVYNSTFRSCVETGAFVRAKLDDLLKQQGLWDDAKQNKYNAIKQDILDAEKKLEQGGIKLSEGKRIALEMIQLRAEARKLISDRTQLDNNTAEGQADNEKFNYMVSACLVYKNTGEPYFANLEAYLNDGGSQEGMWGATQLSSMLYGLDSNHEAKLPEFKFLSEFGFVDDKLRLVNKDGHLVDVDGKLIDEYGRYVDGKGGYCDKDGTPLDSDGNYLVEKRAFLDDDGNPIVKDSTPEPAVEEHVDNSGETPVPKSKKKKIEVGALGAGEE